MGAFSVPEEIRRLKPKGSNIKKIKGNYYVYTNSRHKDMETGKWKTDTAKLIGKIVPGLGYCPNDKPSVNDGVTCFDYGEYLLACTLSKTDLQRLKECFNPDESMQLFSLAVMFALEGYIGLKASENQYEKCLIARDYPALKYSYYRISNLLEYCGRQDKILEFQKKCMSDAKTIAVDGHVIASDSEYSDLSSIGYRSKAVKGEQMNLLVALDTDLHLPVATKVFPGYMVDKSDFLEFIKMLGDIKSKLFIMDKGFYSKDNIKYLIENKASYIIPIASNMEKYKVATKAKQGRVPQFLYTSGKKMDVVEYRIIEDGVTKVFFFRNISEKERLTKAYLEKIEEGAKGYTKEGFEKAEKNFGTVVLETNLSKEAKDIYGLYKSRWSIETYYDRIKNGLNFEELNLSEYGVIQGVAFVMLLAGRIDQRILQAARIVKKTRKELVRLMSALKLYDNGKSATVCNTKKEHLTVAEKIGLSFDTNLKCLD